MTPDFSQLIAKLTDAGFEFVMIGEEVGLGSLEDA